MEARGPTPGSAGVVGPGGLVVRLCTFELGRAAEAVVVDADDQAVAPMLVTGTVKRRPAVPVPPGIGSVRTRVSTSSRVSPSLR
jgi:hypothetical protein